MAQAQAHQGKIAAQGRRFQRGQAFVVHGVDARAGGQKLAGDFPVLHQNAFDERRPAVTVLYIEIRMGGEKRADDG